MKMACIARQILKINTTTRIFRKLATKTDLNIHVVNPDSQIKLSESCVKRLKEICSNGSFLRVTVEGGGCSGFQYKFELDNNIQEDDLSFGVSEVKVVVDQISLDYCKGSILDYHTELIKSGFRMIGNPKAEQGCSCGSSFAIKLD